MNKSDPDYRDLLFSPGKFNAVARCLIILFCVGAIADQHCRAEEDFDLDLELERIAKLSTSIQNKHIEWSFKKGAWPYCLKDTASFEMNSISNQVNEKYDKWQHEESKRGRGNPERLQQAWSDYDLIVHIERRKVGKILLQQLEDEERWIAAHVLLCNLFRLDTGWSEWTEFPEDEEGYTDYWNGLILEQRIFKTESGIRDEIKIPHLEEQRKYLLKHWTALLMLKVRLEE